MSEEQPVLTKKQRAAALLKESQNKQLALLIGSLAAAQSAEDMGNKNPVNKINLLKHLEHILK